MAINPAQQTPMVSVSYINWILATNRGIMGHLYLFTSANGVNDYFTDLDIDLTYNGQTWKSSSLRFEGLQRKLGIGTNVDEQTLRIWAAPTDTLFGAAFLEGAQEGLLDGATITRYRIVWNFNTGIAALDVQSNPLAVWPLFTGYMAALTKGGASHVEFKVRSGLHRLDTNMPRNYYQPGCLWTLFSAGCTLIKASYATLGNVGNNPTLTVIPISGGVITTPTGADGIANYAQGRLFFRSGVNSNLQVLIDNNDTSNLYLAYPLTNLPTVGDQITYYPGCSKAFNTCKLKYGNQANFRGFDKVPPVMVSI